MSHPKRHPVWFITGCSSGLGRALAIRVLAHGHRVVATARRADLIAWLVDRFPGQCRVMSLDVTSPGQVRSVMGEAAATFEGLDVIVNNAGRGLVGALEEFSDDQIAQNFEANFHGAMRVIRSALPILRAQRRGHIVNISAAAAISNYAGFSIYGAAKWALEGASEALAAEVRPLGIHVTLVQPGPFRTDFMARSLERADGHLADYDATSGRFARLLASMDGRQPGDPDKAADAIMAAVQSDRPPLRLVLGRYAHDKARRKSVGALRDLDAAGDAGLHTDFGVTA